MNPILELMAMLGCRAGSFPMLSAAGLNIAGDPHGIKNGWFMWPLNFDPIWLRNCDGFERKENP